MIRAEHDLRSILFQTGGITREKYHLSLCEAFQILTSPHPHSGWFSVSGASRLQLTEAGKKVNDIPFGNIVHLELKGHLHLFRLTLPSSHSFSYVMSGLVMQNTALSISSKFYSTFLHETPHPCPGNNHPRAIMRTSLISSDSCSLILRKWNMRGEKMKSSFISILYSAKKLSVG